MSYEPVLTLDQIQNEISKSKFHMLLSPTAIAFDKPSGALAVEFQFGENIERQPDTGHWHGGSLGAIVDVSGFYSVRMLTERSVTTTHYSIDFMRIANAKRLLATASVRKLGRTLAFVDVNITDPEKLAVAKGSASYAILN